MSRKKIPGAVAVLLLGALLVLCFYTLGQPVIADYSESASALVSAKLFHDTVWMPPTLDGSARFYPAMLNWSQIAGYYLFGVTALGARFFTAVAAVLTIALLYVTSARTLGRRTGLQAAIITSSSLLFVLTARIATGDILASLFLLLSMILCWGGVEAAMQEKKGAGFMLLFGCVSGGLSMLSGGLGIGLVLVCTALFYLLTIGRISLIFRMRWLVVGALLLFITALAPWIISAARGSIDILSFLQTVAGQEAAVFSGAMPHYGRKVGLGLLLLLLGMSPWCCYLGLAITTSSLFGKELPSQRFVRLFVIFSMMVLFIAPLTVHGVGGLVVAAVPGAALLLAQLFERIDVQYSKRWILAGWLTVSIFLVLTLLSVLLPFLLNILSKTFGEFGQLFPALYGTVDFGYANYAAGGLLACLSYLLFRGVKRRKVYAVYNGLTLTACALAFITVLLAQPVYDRIVMRPVSVLAAAGARHTPVNGTILLYNINNRASAAFYGERAVLVKSESSHGEIEKLFNENGVQVAISTSYSLKRLEDFGVKVKELEEEHGFVLFTLD